MDVVWLHDEDFDSIGDAIREKLDTETEYKLGQMAPAIDSIPISNCDVDKIIDGTITEVYLPGITRINCNGFFYKCANLVVVDLPDVTSIGPSLDLGGSTFYNCTSLTTVNLPKLTETKEFDFRNCTSLINISLPSLTKLGSYTFDDCTSLATVNLPNVTLINNGAFDGCTNLNNLVFPSLTKLGVAALQLCSSLTSLTLPGSTVCTGSNGMIAATPIASGNGYIYVPADLVDSYKSAQYWSTYASQIVAISE